MIFFPTFQAIGDRLEGVPEALRVFLGDANTYRTIEGFTDLQVFGQMHFILIVFGVILFTGVLAGEEREGTLRTLLAQPVRRGRVYVEKLLGCMGLLAVVCVCLSLAAAVGAMLVGESLPIDRLITAGFAIWLISLVFSSLGFALGAATGRRGLAGTLAGALAFVSLLVNTLAVSADSLKTIDKFLPLHYFNNPGILQYGADWTDLMVLAAVSIFFMLIGAPIFNRRDIHR
jgi:ABC-2 type transport system permease protein